MRALTSITTLLTLALGLAACGDDGGKTTQTSQNPTAETMTATDPSAGSTTAGSDGSTTEAPTTMNPTTPDATTGDDPTVSTAPNPTAGTMTGGDETAGGGEDLYGPCMMTNPPCPGGQNCLRLMGVEGNFCAPACEGASCPAVPDGVGAKAQCVLAVDMEAKPTACALVCDLKAMGQCPEGETCKEVPMPMGLGLCTAP